MSGPTREQVVEWATSTGFTKRIQPGGAVDFNPYVYEFAALAYTAGKLAERDECIEGVRTVGGKFSVECEALIRDRGE